MRRFAIVSGLAAMSVVAGCVGSYESDFPVVVANYSAGTIKVFVDASDMGM
jgi:hypothetical protein